MEIFFVSEEKSFLGLITGLTNSEIQSSNTMITCLYVFHLHSNYKNQERTKSIIETFGKEDIY
jgi:hypothetical protein